MVLDLLDAYDGAQAYVDFYIADAEAEYEYSKCGACVSASDWWTARFRSARPAGTFEAALSSWGRTDLADVYYMSWRDRGFAFLPQTYWNDPNAGAAYRARRGGRLRRGLPRLAERERQGPRLQRLADRLPVLASAARSIPRSASAGAATRRPTATTSTASPAPTADFGATGFSIFEGQYIPADSASWGIFGDAIDGRHRDRAVRRRYGLGRCNTRSLVIQ